MGAFVDSLMCWDFLEGWERGGGVWEEEEMEK